MYIKPSVLLLEETSYSNFTEGEILPERITSLFINFLIYAQVRMNIFVKQSCYIEYFPNLSTLKFNK